MTTGNSPIKVLCVEDDAPTRQRLTRALTRDRRFAVEQAGTLEEARVALSATVPNVLLVDLDLPDGNGINLIREVHQQCPEVEIIVISVFCDERNVVSAIAAGASGYMLKDALSSDIAGMILDVLAGHSPVSAAIARFILKQLRSGAAAGDESTGPAAPAPLVERTSPEADPAARLTPREVDILTGIAKGFSYREIAGSLGLSQKTVPNYIKSIYRKLQVHSRSEAVFEAIQQRLIRF
jgi:DNA-binding NarL/FixJ family response regulator